MAWCRITPEMLPEAPRRQDSDRQLVRDLKKVAVAGDQHFGAAGDGLCQDGHIRLIAYSDAQRRGLVGNDGFPAQELIKLPDRLAGYPNFLSEHSLQFTEHGYPDNKLVLGQYQVEDIRTQPAGRGSRLR